MNFALLDKDFLAELDEQQDREVFARITALDFQENPLQAIEGHVTAGSVNVDGTSAVRRTCNLTIISQGVDINDFYWGIKTKFMLEVGLANKINKKYDPIIWFPQGIYLISAFNTSIGTSTNTITIQGKDKMCLLNGDMGGQLPASIDFGREEKIDVSYSIHNFNSKREYTSGKYWIKNGYKKYEGVYDSSMTYYEEDKTPLQGTFITGKTYYIEDYILSNDEFNPNTVYYDKEEIITFVEIPLYKIIKEAVHAWAGEPYHNIIINDLDTYGLEQLQYKGDTPLYALKPVGDSIYNQMTLQGNKQCYRILDNNKSITLSNISSSSFPLSYFSEPEEHDNIKPQVASAEFAEVDENDLTWVVFSRSTNAIPYTVLPLKYGDDVGYRITDLTYTGELISTIGETITSILDKIKNMLGDFEYFYNLEGQFVFQRKRTFIETSWNSIQKIENDIQITPSALASPITYNFIGNKLITAFNNNPALNNMRNDYTVWGNRKSVSGTDIPIHARYAIDKKPLYYKAFNGKIYVSDLALFEKTLEEEEAMIAVEVNYQVAHFVQQYNNGKEVNGNFIPWPEGLKKATRRSDGTWTPGWWDVDDWAEYYKLIYGTYPTDYMRNYATHDESGFVNMSDLNLPYSFRYYTGQIWLFNLNKDSSGNYYYDNQHQGGNYYSNHNYPWGGCTVHHYPDFQRGGSLDTLAGYFYNPAISQQNKTEVQLIEERIEDLKKEYEEKGILNLVDWREIIYQMALDYFKYSNADTEDPIKSNAFNTYIPVKDTFLEKVRTNNPTFYPTGYTGYEQYYTDIQGFWRELYNPEAEPEVTYSEGSYQDQRTNVDIYTGTYETRVVWDSAKITDVKSDFYLEGTFENGILKSGNQKWDSVFTSADDTMKQKYQKLFIDSSDERKYWNKAVFEAPETLNFWFDFFDSTSELGAVSVPVVGDRTKVVNDSKVTSIYFKQIPEFIFTTRDAYNKGDWVNWSRDQYEDKTGYSFLFLPKGMEKLFSISYRGKSAKNEIDSMIYQYSYCTENVTITTLPVYYLEPNNRIFINDKKTNINGEYIITKLTIPLTYNGTMSITANKAPVRIY